MLSPHWEPISNPLDELREIARTTHEAGCSGLGCPLLGCDCRCHASAAPDWEAWEREIDSPTLRAALEYWEGE